MSCIAVQHPLIQDALAYLRNRRTDSAEFRRQLKRISLILAGEAVRDLSLKSVEIETPLCSAEARTLVDPRVVIAPVLRAGLGMLDAMLELLPLATVAFIGLYRDEETFSPREYYHRLPHDLSKKVAIILDPMCATGGTLVASINLLKERGAKDIRAITIVAAPEGVAEVERIHPDVSVYTASIDERLNERAYIIPGLGDAGNRLFPAG